jgi:hypothetical protein
MAFSLLNTLPNSASKDAKVCAAIQDLTGRQVVSLAYEAKNYCFKANDSEVYTIDIEFVNDYIGI